MEGYRSGEPTLSLAEAYGCSQNTVIRTVKALLPPDEYNALKASRSKGESSLNKVETTNKNIKNPSELSFQVQGSSHEDALQGESNNAKRSSSRNEQIEEEDCRNTELGQPLALDDADDFNEESPDEAIDNGAFEGSLGDQNSLEVFHEVVPLLSEFQIEEEQKEIKCAPLIPGVLPGSVYMLVDRLVELDARPLKDFPELGTLSEADLEKKALSLFSTQRSARRHCGRSQRVIKVPDSNVFTISTPFLLARGITRLVLEGSLISLDSGNP